MLLKRPAELLVTQALAAFVPSERRREFRDGLDQLPLVDRAHDWHVTILPHGGARTDVAAHVEVIDGDRLGDVVMCWMLRPLGATPGSHPPMTHRDAPPKPS